MWLEYSAKWKIGYVESHPTTTLRVCANYILPNLFVLPLSEIVAKCHESLFFTSFKNVHELQVLCQSEYCTFHIYLVSHTD